MRVKAAEKSADVGTGRSEIARPAAYLNPTAKPGVKAKNGAPGDRSGLTISWTFEDGLRNPVKPNAIPLGPRNIACSFLDSSISLVSRSLASCAEMSDAVPDKGMFLLLVRLCGVIEAKYWADALGLPGARSYGLIEPLLDGPRKQAVLS